MSDRSVLILAVLLLASAAGFVLLALAEMRHAG
jgi:hypothetical protein